MPNKYLLQIKELHKPYADAKDRDNSTMLVEWESTQPFGAFHAGDTIANMEQMKFLGRIEHILHQVGEGGGTMTHRTILHISPKED